MCLHAALTMHAPKQRSLGTVCNVQQVRVWLVVARWAGHDSFRKVVDRVNPVLVMETGVVLLNLPDMEHCGWRCLPVHWPATYLSTPC